MGLEELRKARAKVNQAPEDNPALRIIHNDMQVLTKSLDNNVAAITAFAETQSAMLATYITEVGKPLSAGLGTYTFDAQTADIELVVGLYAWFPDTVTNAEIDLGTVQLPLAPGWSQLVDINLLADRVTRRVSWDNVQPTDTPFVVLFTRPAPGGIPGQLHG